MFLLFWLLVFLTLYSYLVYPLILLIMVSRNNTGKRQDDLPERKPDLPIISLIITAHNEQDYIAEKIKNSIGSSYPVDKMQIIVASDCSNDDTDKIVSTFLSEVVETVRADERRGKEYAQWLAIQKARGQIIVFSDVATTIPEDSFNVIAEIFEDPRIGAVSSEDRFLTESGEIVGEGLYVKYEMWLRNLESQLAGLVGLSGSFFAARKEICEEWDTSVPSDFNTALNCVSLGFMAVSDSRLVGYYRDIKDDKREYQRKVRTVIRGQTALLKKKTVLNPFKYGLFAFQVWGHKIMRWAVPCLLIMMFGITLLLYSEHFIYSLALFLQLLFYSCALAGYLNDKLRANKVVRIVYYFVITNLAILEATVAYIFGRRVTMWTPSAR